MEKEKDDRSLGNEYKAKRFTIGVGQGHGRGLIPLPNFMDMKSEQEAYDYVMKQIKAWAGRIANTQDSKWETPNRLFVDPLGASADVREAAKWVLSDQNVDVELHKQLGSSIQYSCQMVQKEKKYNDQEYQKATDYWQSRNAKPQPQPQPQKGIFSRFFR